MEAPDIDIVRGLSQPVLLRAAAEGDGSLGTLTGHFSTFNNWYQVSSLWEGEFLERMVPGAFKDTIAEDRKDMRILFDHGFDPTLGNKVLAPIDTLREEDLGPYYEGGLFDTSYNRDLLPGLRKGVYGASMRFRVTADSWDDEPAPSSYNPKGIPERSVLRTRVMEFGPVTFPANPGATAGMRSLTDRYYDQLQQRNASAYEAALRSAGPRVLERTGRHVAGSAAGGDLSGDRPGNGPATSSLSAAQARHRRLQLLGVIRS